MKTVGCVWILLLCIYFGLHAAKQLGRRKEQLKSLEKSVLVLQRAMEYKKAALSEAFFQTAESSDEPWKLFFTECGKAFFGREAFQNSPKDIFERKLQEIRRFHSWQKDLNLLREFGKGLGEQDKQLQISKVRILREDIGQAVKEAREEQEKKAKLFQTLGVCMGILGVILVL